MDKDITEFLEWLTDEGKDADNYLWSINDALTTQHDIATFKKIFTEEQAEVVRVIIKQTVYHIDKWHNEQDENSHKDLRQLIEKLKAQFRNHRHDNSKNLGGKAEY